MRNVILALAAAASLAAPAAARPDRAPLPVRPGEEVSIPFVDFGGIRSFEAYTDQEVYLEDRHRNWYKAELIGPCFGLNWATGIGIDTHGGSSFDHFSRLIVGRERCQIGSLTRSDKPEKPWKKKRA
jgi:hypothetical protein